jgi:hypothetical protein
MALAQGISPLSFTNFVVELAYQISDSRGVTDVGNSNQIE